MGQLVYILGRSGTGKSYSLRNFDPSKIALINVQGKALPFKGSGRIASVVSDDSDSIVRTIKGFSTTYRSIIVDDFQYVMANEFMRRASERGYDKFTEIARHAWDIAECVRNLPSDVIVYILCHTDTDDEGIERLKTIGKLLDEKIVMEGMSTIVLKTNVSDGKYSFLTQNNGKDTTKSPAGMFPSYAIDNDLKYVDDKIRNYYEIGDYKSDEEMAEDDKAVAHEDVVPEEKKSRRGRRAKEEQQVTETSQEEKEETKTAESTTAEERESRSQRRRRNLTAEAEKEKEEERKEFAENLPNADSDKEEVPFDEITPLPTRKDRTEETAETVGETAPRRRRRRI